MRRIALSLLALALSWPVYAQDVNWTVVLQTATVGYNGQTYLPIISETTNGQPVDLSRGAGMSVVIGPNVYYNSSSYGFIVAQVPPIQPWDPTQTWYSWDPTLANTQRGTPQATQNVMIFTETDTFQVENDVTFYKVWPEVWNGTLVRTLNLHEKCGRWPCGHYVPIAQCTPVNRCYISFSDASDVMTLTATFPIPTPPPYQ